MPNPNPVNSIIVKAMLQKTRNPKPGFPPGNPFRPGLPGAPVLADDPTGGSWPTNTGDVIHWFNQKGHD